MDIASDIRIQMADEWIGEIYAQKIRVQRTRAINLELPERENQAEILYTLLGIELKVGKRRFACPDLAAARYMRVFARLGCRNFALPYDITRISAAADQLETSWHRALLLLDESTRGRPSRAAAQARSRLVKLMRSDVNEAGPGDTMPAFDRETRQRSPSR